MEVADGAGDDEENAGRVPSAAETLNELRNIMNDHECIEGTVSDVSTEEASDDLLQVEDDGAFDVPAILDQVMAKQISLQEKIKLLNMFAGACYQKDDMQSAFDLLSAALELDGFNADVLKNIA